MISFLRHWPIAIYVFYFCLIAPAVFACEASLDLKNSPSFVDKGTLGNETDYLQRVYSSQGISYSTIVFPSKPFPNKKILLRETIKQMVSTAKVGHKNDNPQVKVLNEELLPKLDNRLAFLTYINHGRDGFVNVEAAGLLENKSCWAILRFTAQKKETRDVALNEFANLIRKTRVN